jgi:hypothetical protein
MQMTCPTTPGAILLMSKLDRICPCGVVGRIVAGTLGTILVFLKEHYYFASWKLVPCSLSFFVGWLVD